MTTISLLAAAEASYYAAHLAHNAALAHASVARDAVDAAVDAAVHDDAYGEWADLYDSAYDDADDAYAAVADAHAALTSAHAAVAVARDAYNASIN